MNSMLSKSKFVLLGLVAVGLFAVVGCTTGDGSTPSVNSNSGGTIFNVANSAEVVRTPANLGLTAQLGGQGDSNQFINYVTVAGTSDVQVVPDKVDISLSVTSKADTVAEATTQAGNAQEQVLTDTRAIDGADDFSSTLSIRQDFIYNRELSRNVPDGFTATYNINFSIVDDDDVGALAGDAVAAAVNAGGDLLRVNSVSFTLDDRSTFEATARRNAAENARLRAGDYASGLDVTLGDVLAISEVSSNTPQPFAPTRAFALDNEAAPVQSFEFAAGLVTVSASVQVSFAITN